MGGIGDRLTRVLIVPIIVGISLLYAAVISSMIYINLQTTNYTSDTLTQQQLVFNKSLFNSKGSQISNLFQCFFTDLQLTKRMIQNLSANLLNQKPSQPTERDWYY